MNCSKVLIFTIVILGGFSFSKAQNRSCEALRLESKKQLKVIKTELISLENPRHYHKTDLLSIVLPEYLTYNNSRNTAEITLIQLYHSLGLDAYKRISTGPFQMQLEFIHDNLAAIPISELKDSKLRACKKGGYASLLNEIAYLNKLSTQWEILRCFEFNQLNSYKKRRLTLRLRDLYALYNQGNVNEADPKWSLPFSKISCKLQPYAAWCDEMKGWYLQENALINPLGSTNKNARNDFKYLKEATSESSKMN